MPAYPLPKPRPSSFLAYFLACALLFKVVPYIAAQGPDHERLNPTPLDQGNFYLIQKQYQQALEIFKGLVEKEPSNNYGFRSLVRAWNGLNRLVEGEAYLKDYLSTRPMSDSAMYGLGYLYYLDKRWSESEEFLIKAIESNPENSLALNNLGALYAQHNNFSKAEALIKKAIDLRPSELIFYTNLFGVYAHAGVSNKFEREFHQQVKRNSRDTARGYGITLARHKRQEGFLLYSQGKLKETIGQFLELLQIYNEIERDSGIIATLFSLGILYEEQGNMIKAKESFRNVLKINPKHAQAQERMKALKNE